MRDLIHGGNVVTGTANRAAAETPRAAETTPLLRDDSYRSRHETQMDAAQLSLDQYSSTSLDDGAHQPSRTHESNATTSSTLHTDLQYPTDSIDNTRENTDPTPNTEADIDGADVDIEAEVDVNAGPSPSEANVAGAISHDGKLAVHGVSSIFHHPARLKTISSITTSASIVERKLQNQVSEARLIANAALQQQRERILLRGISSIESKIDLDGVNAELAFHLLDLHWNRQHYTYLISYRPAIMDSLMNNGPYVNTLLLNAIYFSSSILSDRLEVRSDPGDPQTAGLPFYNRFRALLVDNIDKPSIPTATALLLCGAALVSHGRPSAGWIMCGIAYRMIIDLGCHMTVDSRRSDRTGKMALPSDIELEIRKRLYWGAFLTDATQSLYFGRPPCLQASQARVPQLLLDTFEELEDWTSYLDPLIPPDLPPYSPRPAYAISTLNVMTRLLSISSKIVHSFYSIKSLKDSPQHIRNVKTAAESELDQWLKSIPTHLRFDPETDDTPPPHQVTLLYVFSPSFSLYPLFPPAPFPSHKTTTKIQSTRFHPI